MESQDSAAAGAIHEAFELYRDCIASHCRRYTKSREEAEDVLQDTFLHAFEYVRKGRRIEHMKTFLYSVANHLLIDRYRKLKDKKIISLEWLCEQGFDPGYEETTLIQNKMDAWRILHDLKKRKGYGLLMMRYMKGMQNGEISSITGLKSNLVAVTLHRMMRRLSKKLVHTRSGM